MCSRKLLKKFEKRLKKQLKFGRLKSTIGRLLYTSTKQFHIKVDLKTT